MQTMRAWMSHKAAGPASLTLDDVAVPAPDADEVRVRVLAVGVNFPDGLLIRDEYQIKPPRPFIPGSEFCGVIDAVGADVTRVDCGDVVVGACGWGALAECIVVGQAHVMRIPAGFPPVEAAAFLFTYATAYHALYDVAQLTNSDTLLVLGAAGGVGTAAVEVGRATGATVIAGVSSQDKLDFAVSRGASDGLVYPTDLHAEHDQRQFAGRLKELVPNGLDVIVDPVGGPYTEPALRSLARGGRHLVVGFAAGIPSVPLNIVLLRGSHVIGVDWRSFIQTEPERNQQNLEALVDMWQSRRIAPQVTEVFEFDAAPAAIARLESRHTMGKIVVSLEA